MTRSFCLGLLAACFLLSQPLAAEERHALIIGNSKYKHEDADPLTNPVNDADAMEVTLKKLGFSVIKKTDVDIDGMEAGVAQFKKSLKRGDVALFFYAGHGLQVKGENFLTPLGVKLGDESEVKRKCFAVQQVLDAMESSQSYIKVVILDCCRNNPYTRGWTRGDSKKGLSKVDEKIPDGTLIAFSTSPNTTALDGKGPNSPYTTHLVAALNSRPKEGLELKEAFFEASAAVKEETGQNPWLHIDGSLRKYYLWRDVASVGKPLVSIPRDPPAKPADKPADDPAPPDTKSLEKSFTNSLGMKLQLIPAGEFLMGSPESELSYDDKHAEDEKQHRVRITKPFYMGVYAVTQAEYEKLMGKNPSYFSATGGGKDQVKGLNTTRCPVEQVSWDDAVEFCRKLSAKEGRTYRLPTEAEWEYACRAGTTTPFHFGGSLNGDQANCDGNYPYGTATKGKHLKRTTSVGSYTANAFGLYDMHGNVWQWCADWYDKDYYSASPLNDPPGPDAGSFRVLRGGGWKNDAVNCRSANRFSFVPAYRDHYLGFRVVAGR